MNNVVFEALLRWGIMKINIGTKLARKSNLTITITTASEKSGAPNQPLLNG